MPEVIPMQKSLSSSKNINPNKHKLCLLVSRRFVTVEKVLITAKHAKKKQSAQSQNLIDERFATFAPACR